MAVLLVGQVGSAFKLVMVTCIVSVLALCACHNQFISLCDAHSLAPKTHLCFSIY